MSLKKYDSNRVVYVDPKDDVWYVLSYNIKKHSVVMTYYDQRLPLSKQRPIHKVLQATRDGSTIDGAMFEMLNNYEIAEKEYIEEYKPVREYYLPETQKYRDLTDIANNLKMPKDFRDFMFEVSGRGSVLTVKTFVTAADIEKYGLDTRRMNEYLNTLKDFIPPSEWS